MDASKIAKNIAVAFLMIAGLVGILGTFIFGFIIVAIIVGTLITKTTDGSLPVNNNTTTLLGQAEHTFHTVSNYLFDGIEFAGALIIIAVILVVFAGVVYLGYKGYKSAKGGAGGNYV